VSDTSHTYTGPYRGAARVTILKALLPYLVNLPAWPANVDQPAQFFSNVTLFNTTAAHGFAPPPSRDLHAIFF
jgi:hypothetical protein